MNILALRLLVAAALSATLAAPGLAAPLSIENAAYSVTVDSAGSGLSIVHKLSGRTFVTAGTLGAAGGVARIVKTDDKTFGAGKGIEVAYPDGRRDTVALYPDLPFVLVRTTLHNGAGEPVVTNKVQGLSVEIDAGVPASSLRAFGTGGLLPLEKNPGSYAFLAVVDPATRAGVVSGWLSHDRGSGVVFSPVKDGKPRLDARIEYGRLRIKPGQDEQLEAFAIGFFDDARFGLEAYADAIAKIYAVKLPTQPSGFCTWYTEKHSGACDAQHLKELAAFASAQLKPYGFDFVQIDDGWQDGITGNGPRRNFTTVRANGPYAGGMKQTADDIKSQGLTPGIWFMPFAGTSGDPYFKEHQDWFAKGPDGKPYETAWGGTCLDMTQSGAREHLRGIVNRIAHEWGYTLFKMDGLWTGTATKQIYVNDGYKEDHIGETALSNPDKTNIEAFRDGLKLVREVAGSKVFLLGCCVSQNMRSFGGSLGLVDAMRVGPDTGAGEIGSPHASRLWFLHGRVWYNDPDCVSVRASTPLDRARLNASFTAIGGFLFYNSDWMPDLPADRLDVLKRTVLPHGLKARPVDVFECEPARIWLLTDARGTVRRDVVAFYNWNNGAQVSIACPVDRIGLPKAKQYVAFDFWANKFVPPFGDAIASTLPGGSCRILAVRPVSDHPQLLSTSRHISQGMVDVTGETWDAAAKTLSGASRVVANDPYELRIVVPVDDDSWRATDVKIDGDAPATFKQDGPNIRVAFNSTTSREVHWRVKFERGAVVVPAPQPVRNVKAEATYFNVRLSWDDVGADLYRVIRGDGSKFETAAPLFTDSAVEHGKTYRYSVTSVGWGGVVSAPVEVEAVTPAELKRPPTPPAPTVLLSDLKPVSARVDWGALAKDKSIEGKPLTVGGKRYARGIGLHASALAVYAVPAGASRFVAVVGLDDEKIDDERSSVVFQIYGDVKEMGEKPALLDESPVLSSKTVRSWSFDLPLNSRFKELRVVVTDAGDGIASDHADLVDAGFLK